MRNIVKFDVRTDCKCACVANIFCLENRIVLIYEADAYTAPKIVFNNGRSMDLTVENGVATGELPYTDMDGLTDFQIRYVDGDKAGIWFNWTKPEIIKTDYATFVNVAYENDVFNITVKRRAATVTDYSADDFTVTDDGELKLKKVTDIDVTKNADDLITNVTLTYDDESKSSNECSYDNDGNLIKFGDLNINWG